MKRTLSLILVTLALASGIFFHFLPVKTPDLTVVGYVNLRDGLGRQGPELVRAFKDELRMNFVHTRKIKGAEVPTFVKQISAKKQARVSWGKVIVFEDIIWSPETPGLVAKLDGCPDDRIKVAYTMWESTQIPAEWVALINQHFDAVVVPAPFLIDVYRDSGVQVPIFELPLALNFEQFLQAPLKKECAKPMVFANLSAGSDRKNHALLIRAFAKAFGDDPDVELRINMRYSEKAVRNELTRLLAELALPNIYLTQFALSSTEYLEFFKGIDCYVSPSKAEGFSIQPREAMALGIPVIATNNTGQHTICESGLVKSVETPIYNIALFPWGDSYGNNFICEDEALISALRQMKGQYKEYLSKASEARQWAAQYHFDHLKPLYRTLIKPSQVILGCEDRLTADGIITTSQSLYEKYQALLGNQIYENPREIL